MTCPPREPLPGPPARIRVGSRAGVLTVRISGEVDIWLRDQVPEALEAIRWHPGPVELDLARVTFFGAEGVAIVLEMLHARPPGVVAVVATSRAVERTLRLAGLSGW